MISSKVKTIRQVSYPQRCMSFDKIHYYAINYATVSFIFLRAAIACIGEIYEKLGRMVGRSYEETVQILIKALKNAESQGRSEIMITVGKVVASLGSAASNCHKDIFKAAKSCMTDRSMSVRCSAAKVRISLSQKIIYSYLQFAVYV